MRRLGNLINGLKSFEEIKDMTESIELKFKNSHEIYATLIPITREKRGILNFMGTDIKQITGNLDNNDLLQLESDIDQLQGENKFLINQNNEQLKINLQLQDKINSLVNELNKQQDQITKNLLAARNISNNKTFILFKEIFN